MNHHENEPSFVMSCYVNSEALYKAKAIHYMKRFEQLSEKVKQLEQRILCLNAVARITDEGSGD